MNSEQRILLRVATPKDAAMTVQVLQRARIDAHACDDLASLIAELDAGAGALMLAEEVLGDAELHRLSQALAAQPPWSDVPVIVLARQGADSHAIGKVMDRIANVTVIERPVRVAAMISTARSVLRARRRQYELRRLLDGLHEADRRKNEFLATLAHELRNPLAPLRTALALLERSDPSPQTARYQQMMRRQVDYMVRLVDDLMEVSRITRGKIELQLRPLVLSETIAGAVELARPQIDAAGHTLSLALPAEPLPVNGDAVRLTQVFANVLNNAAKYTPRGGRIEVLAARDAGQAVVSVTDTGAGIEPEMLDPIFEMFVQAPQGERIAQGGLGIGLTLVRTLVELHGGSVAASSAGPGHGSTFTIRLPLAAAVDADDGGSGPVERFDWAHARLECSVLVVDDNRDAAEALAELLRTVGATVSCAHSGSEALSIAAGQRFDVAVLDIGMPGMDGCELARRLRAAPAHAEAKLIALTGWGQHADQQRIAAAGFDHHLLKPVGAAELVRLAQTPRRVPQASTAG